jgi:hypothetical protein
MGVLLARWIFLVIILNRLDLRISVTVFENESTGQGKDATMYGRHGKALHRGHSSVRAHKASGWGHAAHRARAIEIGIAVDDTFFTGCHGRMRFAATTRISTNVRERTRTKESQAPPLKTKIRDIVILRTLYQNQKKITY